MVNTYAPQEKTRQVTRIAEELKKLGVRVTARRNPALLDPTAAADHRFDCDFCVYLDKDKYAAAILESRGIRLFNRARAIELCDDKMTTHIALAKSGIPMPKTLSGPLCYDKTAKIDAALIDRIEAELGYPVVVKQSYGSLGKGVFKADDRKALVDLAEEVKLNSHLYQKYVERSAGRDLRVIVIGGEVVGGILRESDGDFRSNIGLGGRARAYDVPKDVASYAVRAADVLGLDYCGIDFLLSPSPMLVEVNSNAFFDAFEQATGINVAARYAKHMIENA